MPPLFPTLGRCQIPAFGIGTYELCGEECTEAVRAALARGFRLIDTAAGYRNEDKVGAGIRESGVPRNELFVVIKVSPKAFVSEELVTASVRSSVEQLGIGYADVVLMHWPGCGGLKPQDAEGHSAARKRTYSALCDMQSEGLVRWVGVSNFLPRHFKEVDAVVSGAPELSASAEQEHKELDRRPVLNQVELHPLCVQADVLAHCSREGIVPQQYSPLGQGKPELLQHPKLVAVVGEHFPEHTVADVLVMWGLSQGYCTIVRSRSAAHIDANYRAGCDYFGLAIDEKSHPLTEKQHDVLQQLRVLMGVADSPDEHFCWYSSEIA